MKQNGVNKLTSQQEEMRMQVVDLELKARYWKAQFDIRHYTLEAEKLQGEYDEYLKEQQKLAEEAHENMAKAIEEARLKMEQPVEKEVE